MNILKSRVVAVGVGAATLALVAGGTGAVAGSMVGSPQIHDNSIRSKDIRDGAVSGKDIRNGVEASIRRRATKGYVNRQVAGASAGIGNISHGSHGVTVSAGKTAIVQVTCVPGDYNDGESPADMSYVALGGGFTARGLTVQESRNMVSLDTDPTRVEDDDYAYNGKGWIVRAHNPSDSAKDLRAWVVCASAPDDNPQD